MDNPNTIFDWRISQFEQLGCTHYEAVLATDNNVDWHEAAKLVKKGCPANLAVEIATPLH